MTPQIFPIISFILKLVSSLIVSVSDFVSRNRCKIDAFAPAKISVDPRITAPYTKVTELVGIHEAKEEVITRLIKGDEQERIVSIAGFGGLGKTTLAKAVYEEIKGQFDCTAFVSASRNPDTKKLLKDIMYELDKEKFKNSHSIMLDEKHLIDLVIEFLRDKRYLPSHHVCVQVFFFSLLDLFHYTWHYFKHMKIAIYQQ